MDRLHESLRALATARTFDDVTFTVKRAARELTGADGVTFVLREQEQCFYADEDAIAPLWKGRRFPLACCISGWVMQTKEIALIPDIYVDARIPHEAYRPTFVKSLLMVPAPQHDPVAALGAYWARQHAANWAQQHSLQALANATALALRAIHVYERQDGLARLA